MRLPITSRTDFGDVQYIRCNPAIGAPASASPHWTAPSVDRVSAVGDLAGRQRRPPPRETATTRTTGTTAGGFVAASRSTGWMLGHRSCCTLPPAPNRQPGDRPTPAWRRRGPKRRERFRTDAAPHMEQRTATRSSSRILWLLERIRMPWTMRARRRCTSLRAYNENERVVARLLAAGADPLVERNDGRTPLHSALRYDAVHGVISVLRPGRRRRELDAASTGSSPG